MRSILVHRPLHIGLRTQTKRYHHTGLYRLNISLNIIPFSHYVVDRDGFSLRKFRSYQDAKWFVDNKPEYMVKKIKINLDDFEECKF